MGVNIAERMKECMKNAVLTSDRSDPLEQILHLGADTPLRAQLAFMILSKALDTTKLVRVERTVARNGKSFVTHRWVRPDKVKKSDVVLQNKGVYEEWRDGAKRPSGKAGKETAAGENKKISPMAKLAAKKQLGSAKEQPKPKAAATRKMDRFAAPGLSREYTEIAEKRYNTALPEAQRAFDKYVGSLSECIGDSHANKDEYSPIQDKINFNSVHDTYGFGGDTKIAGSGLQHELGHLIDRRAGAASYSSTGKSHVSNDAKFINAIKADVKAAEKEMRKRLKQAGYKKIGISNIRACIAREMVKAGKNVTGGVQDIYGGAIRSPYPGAPWKHKKAYWSIQSSRFKATEAQRDNRLAAEAFANMYEACSSEEASAAMEKWLPNAYRRFKEILSEITKD